MEAQDATPTVRTFLETQLDLVDPRMRDAILAVATENDLFTSLVREEEETDEETDWEEDLRWQHVWTYFVKARPLPVHPRSRSYKHKSDAYFSFLHIENSKYRLRATATDRRDSTTLGINTLTRLARATARFVADDQIEKFMIGKCSSVTNHCAWEGMRDRFNKKYRAAGYIAFVGLVVRVGGRKVEYTILNAEQTLHNYMERHPKFDRNLSDPSSGNLMKLKTPTDTRRIVLYLALKYAAVVKIEKPQKKKRLVVVNDTQK